MNLLLFIFCLLSYFIGAIPFGLVLVYAFKGKDIRKIGSGNIGTTNVLRAGYPILAIFTLILDVGKGFIIAFICTYYLGMQTGYLVGLAAVIGHLFPIWLKFKGGKGVATSLGLLLAINPYLFLLSIATWLIIAVIFKYSSLAAILTFILVPIYAALITHAYPIVLSLVLLTIIILIKHKGNIIRLLTKTETKIKFLNKES